VIRHMNLHLTPVAFLFGTLGLASACAPALASYVPHGSYAATCRQIHTEGPYLVAFCARVDGSWNYTRIFVPSCDGDNVTNQNGHLSCGE